MRLVNSNLVRSNAGHASEKHTYRKQSEWRFLACAVSSVGLGPIDGSVRAFHRNQSEMRAQCYLKTSFRTTDIQVTNSRPPTEYQEPPLSSLDASTPFAHRKTRAAGMPDQAKLSMLASISSIARRTASTVVPRAEQSLV